MVVPILVVKRRLGGIVLGHFVLPRRERATQLGVASVRDGLLAPSWCARGAPRAGGAGPGRECGGALAPAAAARPSSAAPRTVPIAGGWGGCCSPPATPAITHSKDHSSHLHAPM